MCLQFQKCWLLLALLSTLWSARCISAETPTPVIAFNVTTKNFQLNFLHEILLLVDQSAQTHLNAYLLQLHDRPEYAQHLADFKAVEQSIKVKHKIVFIKQLLDEKLNVGTSVQNQEDLQTLRNVLFLKKFKHHLHELHEEKVTEMRQTRMYELCRQFRELKQVIEPPFSRDTILASLQPTSTSVVQRLVSVDLADFGRQLYEKVKYAGADIINDYLIIIRKLLHEVIEEKHEDVHDQPKIGQLLQTIDNILKIADFNEKRQQLYAYLGHNITADYEQFKNSEHAGQDLMSILAKVKQKGFDLFVNFLFSNFEFLEQLHAALMSQLKEIAGVALNSKSVRFDENAKLLVDVNTRYVAFKENTENEQKYEEYLRSVKELHAKTSGKPGFSNVHIYELLRDSSENMGSVTLNMIRGKCAEL